MSERKYAVSRHGKTDEPKVAIRRLRLKAEALQEYRQRIQEYMDMNAEVIDPLFSMLREHDKLAGEIRESAKALHTADFREPNMEMGDYKLTKMKPVEKWDTAAIYANNDHGVFVAVDNVVTGVSGDVIVSAIASKKLPSRYLKYREMLEHPDFKVTGPSSITPKV